MNTSFAAAWLTSAVATLSRSAMALRLWPFVMMPDTANEPPTRRTSDTEIAAMTRIGSVAPRSERILRLMDVDIGGLQASSELRRNGVTSYVCGARPEPVGTRVELRPAWGTAGWL